MSKRKECDFLQKLNSLNNRQFQLMSGFVKQGADKTPAEFKFEWADGDLFDLVDLRFNEVKVYLRDEKKQDDDTYKLIFPINQLIADFNERKIDHYEFFNEISAFEENLQKASNSERYFVRWDNYELYYKECSRTVIKGIGGMGKSHFLWECQKRIQQHGLYKHLFIYGKYYKNPHEIPWDDIAVYSNNKEFLLVIDGINEIPELENRQYIYDKLKELSSCKYLRIFVSYRTYSLTESIDGKVESSYLEELLGNTIDFSGVNFDSSIMDIVSNSKVDVSYYYNILNTHNPMHLKMLIESNILTNKRLYDELNSQSIVSLTFIYERFIKASCDKLWNEKQQAYWNAIKELCLILYNSNRSSFNKSDCQTISIDTNTFINNLKNGGYIDTYDGCNYFFIWEELSNCLIARSFFDVIKGKTEDEVVALFLKKAHDFSQIRPFLIAAVADKYKNDFLKFITFAKKTSKDFSFGTLLNIVIKNPENRVALQNAIGCDIGCDNVIDLLKTFGGIPNRVFNCDSFLFEHILSSRYALLSFSLYSDLDEIIRKLKNNLYNINGQYFLLENASEFLRFAMICLLIPDKDVIKLAEKTIYDILEYCDIDFSKDICLFINKCGSSIVKRSIYTVICHLSSNKKCLFDNILDEIENDYAFINAKVIKNYTMFSKAVPFYYVHFNKQNLFVKYSKRIAQLKTCFNEYKDLGGLIACIRRDKLFYSLKIEFYNDLKLNFNLIDVKKRKIIKFNKRCNNFSHRYNVCSCPFDIWDNMFDGLLQKDKEALSPYPLLCKEDLFYGFVAHIETILNEFQITNEEIELYKKNRYRQNKIGIDIISILLELSAEEYLGSLMCNYFQDDLKISYWNEQICIGFAPIEYQEEQLNLCSPLQTYNSVVDRLDQLVLNRLNEIYKKEKNSTWADNIKLSKSSVCSILKPFSVDNTEWIMLCGFIKNRTYYPQKLKQDNYSEECIIVHTATNYMKNRKLPLDRMKTIDINSYNGALSEYGNTKSNFSKNITTIEMNNTNFAETFLVFPPSSIIDFLQLKYDLKQSMWVDKNGQAVIVCNNQNYDRYSDDIGHSVYIKKQYFDLIKDKLGLYYYAFTEKMSHDNGCFSCKSDMHLLIKSGRILKCRMNSAGSIEQTLMPFNKCNYCIFYKTIMEHERVCKKFQHQIHNDLS